MTVGETVLSLPDLPVQLLRCHKIAVAAKAAAAAAQCCRPQDSIDFLLVLDKLCFTALGSTHSEELLDICLIESRSKKP
jgi:hypothetical protein